MGKLKILTLGILLFLAITYSFAQTGAKYLVIAHDNFIDAVKPLVEWKTKKGVKAFCVPLSQTGNTYGQIKSYILNARANWDPRPEYILLVGSPDLLPSYQDAYDDYYANTGYGYNIELCVGRFHCATIAQCSVMVAKTIGYEKTKTMHDSTWYIKGTTVIREDNPPDSFYQPDCRYIRNIWLDTGYIQVDSFISTQGHNQDSIISAINNGRAFVVFRGQSLRYWWQPFQVEPCSTNNGYKLPVIVSGTCATISLVPGESMVGDAFLRAGTTQNPKGAVGYFGTTCISNQVSQYRSLVTKGFFQALFQEGIFTMGGAAKRGKFIMDSILPNQFRYMEWNLLGDPELNIWTQQPQELTVIHDSVISTQPTNYSVWVGCDSVPVPNALICVMMDSTVYSFDYTDSTGWVSLNFTPQHPGTMQITVTAHDYFPYEGTANVLTVYSDVGVTQIVVPSGTIDSTGPIIPQARIRNYGASFVTCNVTLKIGNLYIQSRSKTLEAGIEDTVNFPAWTPIQGTYQTRCSTYFLGDINPNNDTLSDSVFVMVRVNDVGVVSINSPVGNINSGTSIIPAARIANYGINSETFMIYCHIITGTDTIYYDDTLVTVEADNDPLIYFATWISISGSYQTLVRTILSGDQNPLNDTASNNFTVSEPYWQRLADVPVAPSGKTPKNGTCIASLNGKIYLLKANKTSDFYSFTPNTSTGTWTTLTAIPLGSKENGDGKDPKKGAAITGFDDKIYVLRGNKTSGFWCYNTEGSAGWQKLKNIPTGAKNPKDGSGLVYVNKAGEDCIFAMKGSKTTEFYLYFINDDNWQPVTSPSTGASGKIGYKKGSCLAYDGDSLVYVLKGYYGDFFRYNVLTNTWTELKRYDYKTFLNREGKKKKVKDGSGLVYFDGAVYLLKGGKTNEFWKYDIGADNWEQMNPADIWDIPIGGGREVKSGGALCMLDNFFYAVKGNKTCEFYRHGPPVSTLTIKSHSTNSEGLMENKSSRDKYRLMITPNPSNNVTIVKYNLPFSRPVSIKLYSVNGELIKSFLLSNTTNNGIITIDAKLLPSGVYILRLESGNIKVARKIVLEK